MDLASFQYERLTRIVNALESSLVHLDAAAREALLELPDDEPLRDVELAKAMARCSEEVLKLLLPAREARVRTLPNAFRER